MSVWKFIILAGSILAAHAHAASLKTKCEKGCVLSPYRAETGGAIVLSDLQGGVVKKWPAKAPVFVAKFLPPKHIVSAEIVHPDDFTVAPGHAPTGALRVYDLKGDLVWEYLEPLMHHDFEVLPDGKIAILRWHALAPADAKSVKGGVRGSEWKGKVWGEEIVELEVGKGPVFRASVSAKLDKKNYKLPPKESRGDWLHANALKYYASTPFGSEPAYLLSFRSVSKVVLVERKSMRPLWESRSGEFGYQHDPTMTGDSLWVFDNRTGEGISRLVQIDMKTHKLLWQYNGGESYPAKLQFYTPIMGSLQVLGGDTFMVTASVHGYIFGLSKEKRRLWAMFPGGDHGDERAWKPGAIFKAVFYAPSELAALEFP